MHADLTPSEAPSDEEIDRGAQSVSSRRFRCCGMSGARGCLLCSILIVVAGLAAGVIWLIRLAEAPTAVALLRVTQSRPWLPFGPVDFAWEEKEFERYKQTQKQLIASRFVLVAALRDPEVAALECVKRQDDPVDWLAGRLQVTFPGESQIMEVSMSGGDPIEAVAMVNAVVDTYLQNAVHQEINQRRLRLNELDQVYAHKQTQARKGREQLKSLAEMLGACSEDPSVRQMRLQVALQMLVEYQREWFRLKYELRRVRAELESQQTALNATQPGDVAGAAAAVKELEIYAAALAEHEQQLATEVKQKRAAADRLSASSIELEMMRAEVEDLEQIRRVIATERERLRLEVRSPARVTLLQRAEVPK